MKLNKIIFIFSVLLLSLCAVESRAQENILQPKDFVSNFPEITWGMSVAEAKKAVEKTGCRPVIFGNEMAWDGKFGDLDGRGSLRFSDDGKLNEIVVQTYYFEKGKETYEAWLKKLTEKHGAPKEEISGDVISEFWEFKDGFSIELRLAKGEGENRFMTDLHWVKPLK